MVQFTSSTFGKLNKIKNGNVFSDSYVFIKEFLQNCQRSQSKNVFINYGIDDNGVSYFECYDDGCGCKKPENIFTLDYSEWESTNEGFGIGFLSCLAIPNLSNLTIKSKNWIANVDINELFKNEDLDVDVNYTTTPIDGFYVRLESPWFGQQTYSINSYLQDVGKYLSINIYDNGEKLYQVNVLDEYESKCESYHIRVDNALFSGILTLSNDSYDFIKIYYEDRYVRDMYVPYLKGVIVPKKNKITLREPDREDWQRDTKYYKLKDKISECAKQLYKSFIKEYGIGKDLGIGGINEYLETRDFQKYLSLSFLEDDARQMAMLFENDEIFEEKYDELPDLSKDESCGLKRVDKSRYKENNQVIENTLYDDKIVVKQEPNDLIKNDIQKNKNILKKSIWVRSTELEDFKNMVAKARYCNIPIIVVDNILQEKVLEEKMVAHISTLNDVLKETIIKNNIKLKNANEVSFIKFLAPICNYYGLELDTFRIANLETIREFTHNGEVVMKSKEKNTKNLIVTYGLCDGCHIYLDRNALKLSRFKITNCSKATKYNLLLHTSRTIAHELAHYLYKTQDNTIKHYKKEQEIWMKIISLYD